MRHLVLWRFLLSALLLAAALVGCGSTPTATPMPSPTPAPTAVSKPTVTAEQVSAALKSSPFLDKKHVDKGLTCEKCHPQGTSTPPTGAACLGCHGPVSNLAAKTKAFSPNPHQSHLAEDACLTCHAVHGPFTFACADCHNEYQYKGRFPTAPSK